jgi:redox-sensitive bicupin YhaK (pirin superfamily)
VSFTPAPIPRARPVLDRVVIEPRLRDLGGFSVRRVLPAPFHRMVGPFIFFDHMGPAEFAPGGGIDVRPHPHINLATVTYLFEGEILHRDSLGSAQAIRPGAINWMTAGRGIVHSERTPPELRAASHRLHGLQIWVALPRASEEQEPAFHHHPAEALPLVREAGIEARVLVGSAFGVSSPVRAGSPLAYLEVALDAGAVLPLDPGFPERAVYLVDGAVLLGGVRFEAGRMILLAREDRELRAESRTRLVVIAGEPLDGERHIEWNFVSSSRERIEAAKDDWRAGRFPLVPGDDQEFIPLPD